MKIKEQLDHHREVTQKLTELVSKIINKEAKMVTYTYTDNNNDAHFIYLLDGEPKSILIPLARLEECFNTSVTSLSHLCNSYVEAVLENYATAGLVNNVEIVSQEILKLYPKEKAVISFILDDLPSYTGIDPETAEPTKENVILYGDSLFSIISKYTSTRISSSQINRAVVSQKIQHITFNQEADTAVLSYDTPDLYFKIHYEVHDGINLTHHFEIIHSSDPHIHVGTSEEANKSYYICRFILVFELNLLETQP